MSYVEHAVGGPVVCVWERTVGAPAPFVVVPDACVDVIFSSVAGLIVAGPDTGPHLVDAAPGAAFAGVRLRPGTAAAVLGVEPAFLRDTRAPAREVLGDRAARWEDALAHTVEAPAPTSAPALAPCWPPTSSPVGPPAPAPGRPPTSSPVGPPAPAPGRPPTSSPVGPPAPAPGRPPTSSPVGPPAPAPGRPPTSSPAPRRTPPPPPASPRVRAVSGGDPGPAAQALAAALLPLAARARPDPLAARAVALLDRPAARVAAVAATLGVSERTLRRRVEASSGYAPKTLARVLRFQRLIALAGDDAPPAAAELALDAGYADQAHMTAEVGSLAGVPAVRFLKERTRDAA